MQIDKIGFIFIFTLLTTANFLCANCPRCSQIESERELDKGKKTTEIQPYYDDLIDLHKKASGDSSKDDLSVNYSRLQEQSLAQNEASTDYSSASLLNEKTYSIIFEILSTKDFLATLSNSFTLFVPTNEALMSLPPQLLFDLFRPQGRDRLMQLVSNHIVSKQILRKDFDNQSYKSLSGRNIELSTKDNKLTVNGARILKSEPSGNDGTIYVIDQVLYP